MSQGSAVTSQEEAEEHFSHQTRSMGSLNTPKNAFTSERRQQTHFCVFRERPGARVYGRKVRVRATDRFSAW